MHGRHVGRGTRPAIAVLSLAALLVLGSGAAIGAAPQRHLALAGTWSGQYGGAYSGTFTLHWTQSGAILHGSIRLSNPPGKYGINGSVHGSAIKFGAATRAPKAAVAGARTRPADDRFRTVRTRRNPNT
jgi:hypothetical protein